MQVSESLMGPGDWIGDVEILEKCPRLNTYVTLSELQYLIHSRFSSPLLLQINVKFYL